MDAFLSVSLLVLLIQRGELSEIPILIACMQISNHEFLVLISSVILLRTGNNHYARIDACGAWMIIHFLVSVGNVSLLTFEYRNDSSIITNSSIIKKVLLGWKLYFVLLQVLGMIYCYYVVHNPIVFVKDKPKRTQHPLFTNAVTQQPPESSSLEVSGISTNDVRHRVQTNVETNGRGARPRSTMVSNGNHGNGLNNQNTNHGYKRDSCYESYQSLASVSTDTPVRYPSRNPAYHTSELDYANHYSPNQQKTTYVDPIRENSGPVDNAPNYGTIGF